MIGLRTRRPQWLFLYGTSIHLVSILSNQCASGPKQAESRALQA